jgi:MFS family permease
MVVIVSALGYFVDVYDLVLFSTVRIASLRDIGIPEDAFFTKGIMLLNLQMAGMLIGGLLWGIVGDKHGRVAILFGSILLYSIANLGNALVTNIEQYAVLRFIAGFGLAGEIGGAVTLISESMKQEKRGLGTTLITGFGLTGAIFAGVIAQHVDWRTAYAIGGVLGLALLILRMKIFESGMFASMKMEKSIRRGSLRLLFWPPKRLLKYLSCIAIGVPLYFVLVIFMTFAPELTKGLGAVTPMTPQNAVIVIYIGFALGGLASGLISQTLRSRKKVVLLSLIFMAISATAYLTLPPGTPVLTYQILTFCSGFGGGYAAVFFMLAAEQFGTNVRALAATSIPNFVRAATIPISAGYAFLKVDMPLPHAAGIVAITCFVIAFAALTQVEETFSKNLDYVER